MVIRGLERYGKHDLARADRPRRPADRSPRSSSRPAPSGRTTPPTPPSPATGQAGFRRLDGDRPHPVLLRVRHRTAARRPQQPLIWTLASRPALRLRAVPLQRPHGHAGGHARREQTGKTPLSVHSDGPFELRVERGGEAGGFQRPFRQQPLQFALTSRWSNRTDATATPSAGQVRVPIT